VIRKRQIWGAEIAVDGKIHTEEKRASETEDYFKRMAFSAAITRRPFTDIL
jgi:hypothetical protein